MTNFDELKQKAKDTMETIADRSVELYKIAEEKTKILAKTTKLSTEVAFEKGNLRKLYRELGKMYYDLNKTDPDPCFAQTCEEITASLEEIAAKEKEIDELRGYADFEPADEDAADEKDDVEIIVEDFDESASVGSDPLNGVPDTDTLEPEKDDILGTTPPPTL